MWLTTVLRTRTTICRIFGRNQTCDHDPDNLFTDHLFHPADVDETNGPHEAGDARVEAQPEDDEGVDQTEDKNQLRNVLNGSADLTDAEETKDGARDGTCWKNHPMRYLSR